MAATDAGKYECQVSTVPKLSRIMELIVVVPKVENLFHIKYISLSLYLSVFIKSKVTKDAKEVQVPGLHGAQVLHAGIWSSW